MSNAQFPEAFNGLSRDDIQVARFLQSSRDLLGVHPPLGLLQLSPILEAPQTQVEDVTLFARNVATSHEEGVSVVHPGEGHSEFPTEHWQDIPPVVGSVVDFHGDGISVIAPTGDYEALHTVGEAAG